jgi:hypothetical protein
MTARFTYISRGEVFTRPDGFDAELNDLALGRHYSDSLAFGYCGDIASYCEVDNCKLHSYVVWPTTCDIA